VHCFPSGDVPSLILEKKINVLTAYELF